MNNRIVLLSFLWALLGLAGNALAQENLGLYEKIHEDSETSTYELIWSAYDPAVSEEPMQTGDFLVPSGSGSGDGCDGVYPDPQLCPYGAGPGAVTLDSNGEMDRIVVVAKRPSPMIWVWQTSSLGANWNAGRDAPRGISGPASWVRIGKVGVSLEIWLSFASDVALGLVSLTVDWALQDIERFRNHGLHVVNPIGSLIPWQQAQVNWNLYGAGDPSISNMQVLQNFVNAVGSGG